jgi:hypothetical protein
MMVCGAAAQQANAWKYLAALILMLVLMGARWCRKKGVQDFVLTVLLADGILVCVSILTRDIEVVSLLLALLVLGHAALDSYRVRQGRFSQAMTIAVGISYLLHALYSVGVLFALYQWQNTPGVVTLVASILLASASLTYAARQKMGFRILQSLCILGVTYAVTLEINNFVYVFSSDAVLLFLLFLVNLGIMVWLGRMELFVVHLVFAMLELFVQTTVLLLWGELQWELLLPYSLVFAVAGVYLWTRENRTFYLRAAVVQLLCGLVMGAMAVYTYVAGRLTTEMYSALLFLWIGAIWQTIGEAVPAASGEVGALKQVFKTLGMCNGLWGVMQLIPKLVELPQGYEMEWNCAVFGIGIVLLGHIWYDKKQGVEKIQLLATCLLLAILLLADADHGALGNVLIYGVACVGIILVAAIRSRREYVIAASVALALLVLYITRTFWLSIAWWVYLFVAGIVLIVLAIKKEKDA